MKRKDADSCYLTVLEEVFHEEEQERRKRQVGDDRTSFRESYQFSLGRVPVVLTHIEFQILKFLSAKPYRAFKPASIIAAVATGAEPLTDATLKEHIGSLRNKLGMFSDYIQTVPYIGYRFKP